MRGRWWVITLTLIVILLLLILQPHDSAIAQDDGPECPSGFFWNRMSGVGCMQENCLSIPNAKYSYTSSCICVEGYKSCTVPVDCSGIACEPFCPGAELIACVEPDAPCPGEGEDGGNAADTSTDIETYIFDFLFSEDNVDAAEQEEILSALVRDLEDFLAGKSGASPTLGQATAGVVSVTALLTAWVISQLLAGTNRANIIQAISRWRQKNKPAGDSPVSKEKTAEKVKSEPDQTKRKAPTTKSTKTKSARAESPPEADAPLDLPTLRRVRMQEKIDAQKRIEFLKKLQVFLDAEYRRIYADWEVARRCAPVNGVIDIADIYLGLRGKLGTSTVRGAYAKDLLKQAIKGAFKKVVRYRVDGTFEFSLGDLLDAAHSGLGVKVPRPGGAFKQLLQNLAEGKGVLGVGAGQQEFFKTYGKGISKIYGTGESVLSVVGNARKDMDTCEGLREQMSEIHNLFNKTKSDLEDAQTNFDIANSSVKDIDQGIQQLKRDFPNRFKDL